MTNRINHTLPRRPKSLMMWKGVFVLLLMLFLDAQVYAQPGANANLRLWYRSDVGHGCLSGGRPILPLPCTLGTNWADQDAPPQDAVRVGISNIELNMPAINFNEAFSITGNSGFETRLPADPDAFTAIIAMKTLDADGPIFSGDTAVAVNQEFSLDLVGGQAVFSVTNGGFVSITSAVAGGLNTGEPFLIAITRSATGAMGMQINGTSVGTASSTAGSLPNSRSVGMGRDPAATVVLNADYSELLYFNTDLAAADLEDMHAFLALKYGISLPYAYSPTGGVDFYNSSPPYNQNIFGLTDINNANGGFIQPLSESVHEPNGLTLFYEDGFSGTFPNDPYEAIFDFGNNPPNNTSFIMGHDGGGVTFASTYNGRPLSRMDRVYRAENVGPMTGDVTFRFDTTTFSSLIIGSGPYKLIFADDAVFTTNVDSVYLVDRGNGFFDAELPLPTGITFFSVTANTFPNPGGVVNTGILDDYFIWLRGDTGSVCVPPGATPPLSSCDLTGTNLTTIGWEDQSLPQTSARIRTSSGSADYPTWLPGEINFNGAFSTAPSNGNDPSFLFPTTPGPAYRNEITVIAVLKTDNMGTSGNAYDQPAILGGEDFGDGDLYLTMNAGTVNWEADAGNGPLRNASSTSSHDDDIPFLVLADRESGGGGDVRLFINGTLEDNATGGTGVVDDLDNISLHIGQQPDGDGVLDAEFAEYMIINGILSQNERERINSYLGIKYGLTMPHNYLSHDNVTLYDVSTYGNDIIGVGHEDYNGSGYIQPQSRPANYTGLSLYQGAHGNGAALPATVFDNPNAPNINQYCIMGHDGGDSLFGVTYSGIPNAALNRTFKMTGTNSTTDVMTLRIENTGFYDEMLTTGSYSLIVSTNQIFDAGDISYPFVENPAGDFRAVLDMPIGTVFLAIVDDAVEPPAGNPGGIAYQDITTWLRADTGHNSVNMNGVNTGSWFDNSYSGNNGNFVANPQTAIGDLNFNESIRTVTGASVNFNRPNTDSVTVAVVFSTEYLGAISALDQEQQASIVGGLDGTGDAYALTMDDGFVYWGIDNGGSPFTVSSNSGVTPTRYNDNRPHVVVGQRNGSTGEISLFVDGVLAQTNLAATPGILGNLSTSILGEHFGGAAPFDGRYGDVIVFEDIYDAIDRGRLETYLAIKYGVTLGHNYNSYNGTTIYDTTGYANRIIGLASEGLSGSNYNQTVSSSQADPQITLVAGNGTGGVIPATDTANIANVLTIDTYILMGDDDGPDIFGRNLFSNPGQLYSKTWKVQETGDVGTVSLFFNTASITALNGGGNYALITSDDAIFDSNDDVTFLVDNGGGQFFCTENFTASATSFFSIVEFPAPGDIADMQINKWLDGSYGVDTFASASGPMDWMPRAGLDFGHSESVTYVPGGANFNGSFTVGSGGTDDIAMRRRQSADFGMFIVFRTSEIPVNAGYTNEPAILGAAIDNAGDNFGLTLNPGGISWRVRDNNPGPNDHLIISGQDSANEGGLHIAYFDFGDDSPINLGIDGFYYPTNGTGLGAFLDESDSLHMGRFAPGGLSPPLLNGDFAEFIEFDTTVVLVDREKVDTYLAIKYGITLRHDYVQSNPAATVLYGLGAGYDDDIVGIGKDIDTQLDQRVSMPTLAPTGMGIILGDGYISLPTLNTDIGFPMAENNFIIVGHDSASVDGTGDFDIGSSNRMERIYRSVGSGGGGTERVTLVFNGGFAPWLVSGLTDSSFAVVVSANTTFDYTDLVYNMVEWGPNEFAAAVDLPRNGTRFISVVKVPNPIQPGGIPTPATVWVRANSGYTDNGSNDTWENLAQPTNPLTEVAPIPGIGMDTSNNFLNFNPYLEAGPMARDFRTNTAVDGGTYVFVMRTTAADSVAAGLLGQDNSGFRTGLRSLTAGNNFITKGASNNDFASGTEGAMWQNGGPIQNSLATNRWSVISAKASDPFAAANQNALFYIGGFENATVQRFATYDIAEVIVFGDTLGRITNIDQVETYLAIKYGITLNRSYVYSNGTVMFDDVADAAYFNDVAGIAIDDTSGMQQKQSRSINTDALVTLGLDTIRTENALNGGVFGQDSTWIVWGNNDDALCWSNENFAVGAPGEQNHYIRTPREWKVNKNRSVGNVHIQIDTSNFETRPGTGQFYLVMDDDGNYDAASILIPLDSSGTGLQAYFPGNDFDTHPFFTIGARLDSALFAQEDFCGGDIITLVGSHLGDTSLCGFIRLDDGGPFPRDIYRDISLGLNQYVVAVENSGSCLDSIQFAAEPTWASNAIYQVSYFQNPNSQGVTNPQCGPPTTDYTVLDFYPIVDSITIGVGGNSGFTFPDSLVCIGEGNQIAILTGAIPNAPGLFYPVDSVGGTEISVPGLFDPNLAGFLLVHTGVIGTHVIAYDLLGYCPTDVISYDTVEIRNVTPTNFAYSSVALCGNDGVVDTLITVPAVPGTFSSFPPLTFVSVNTGAFNPSIQPPGSYVITFTPDDTACYDPSTQSITIDSVAIGTFFYSQASYCPMNGFAAPTLGYLPITPGGWMFDSPNGGIVDPNSGLVDLTLSPEDTSLLIRYLPPGGATCADTGTAIINIASLPNVDFSPLPGYCTRDLAVSMNPFLFDTLSPDSAWFTNPSGDLIFADDSLVSALATGGPFPVVYHRDSVLPNGVTCTDSMAMLIGISGLPAASISYPNPTATPNQYAFCIGEPNPFPIFSAGASGGVFLSNSPNLMIDSNTGQILLDQSVAAGSNYQISYTSTVSGCTDTILVGNILYEGIPDAGFSLSMDSVCDDASQIGLIFNTGPGTGNYGIMDTTVIVSGITGNNNLNISGFLSGDIEYTIFNVSVQNFGGALTGVACYDTAYQSLNVISRDIASINYPDEVCNNIPTVNPAILGTGGGIFTTTSPVLILDAMTGQIDSLGLLSADTFGIRYTTQGYCPDSTIDSVRVLPGLNSTLSYPQSVVCNTAIFNPDSTGWGGTAGLDNFFVQDTIIINFLNAQDGVLDLTQIAGDYDANICRVVSSQGTCSDTACFQITINDTLDNLSLDYPGDTFCPIDTVGAILLPTTLDINEGQFRPRAGLAYFNQTNGSINLASTTPNNSYTIEYVRSVGCRERVSTEIYVKGYEDADFEYPFATVCSQSDSILPLTTFPSSAGNFTWFADSTISTLVFTNSALGTIDLINSSPDRYAITFTANGFCPATVTKQLTIARQPNIGALLVDPPNGSVCGEQPINFSILEPGTAIWKVDSVVVLTNNNFYQMNNTIDGALVTGIIRNSDNCVDSASVIVEKKPIPDGEPTTWPSVLTGDLPLEILMASFSDSTRFIWNATSSTNIDLDSITGLSEMIDAGTQTTLINGITLSSDFNPGEVVYIIQPVSNGCYGEFDTLVINVNPNNNPIFIPGVMTPNDDSFNDNWEIQWSSDLDPSDYTIILYNRAGGEVKRMNPLNNTWGGDDLPDGVYWWILNGPDGANLDAGGLTIRRR